VAYLDNQNNQFRFPDLVYDPVFSNTNPPETGAVSNLPATVWPWFISQFRYCQPEPGPRLSLQLPERLERSCLDPHPVGHFKHLVAMCRMLAYNTIPFHLLLCFMAMHRYSPNKSKTLANLEVVFWLVVITRVCVTSHAIMMTEIWIVCSVFPDTPPSSLEPFLVTWFSEPGGFTEESC